jgi:hypothetical protein
MLSWRMTWCLTIKASLLLLYVDVVMRRHGFPKLYDGVRRSQVNRSRRTVCDAGALSHIMDVACVLYFNQVLCLQRSAALTLLMRRYGFEAKLVVGTQLFPFLAHAWVEWNGDVVNDSADRVQHFHVLERC